MILKYTRHSTYDRQELGGADSERRVSLGQRGGTIGPDETGHSVVLESLVSVVILFELVHVRADAYRMR